MKTEKMMRALVMLMLIAAAFPLAAADKTNAGPAIAVPSAMKGDPPPGNAMALSIPEACVALKEAITRKYAGTMHELAFTAVLSAATDIHVRASGFELAAPYTAKQSAVPKISGDGKVSIRFRKGQDYLVVYRHAHFSCGSEHCYNVSYLRNLKPTPLAGRDFVNTPWAAGYDFVWEHEEDARKFANAFNRLVYAAYRNEPDPEFIAAAKAWRENPVKPPLAEGVRQQWILAENALKEEQVNSAIEHYESGLEIDPVWPEGHLQVAPLYATLNQYADAIWHMRAYLELVSNPGGKHQGGDQTAVQQDSSAPDTSQIARDQIAIWQAKLKP